jgi:hypothetical protein
MRKEGDAMRLRNTLLAWISVSLILWSGCARIRVSADWDPSARLNSFRTYAWLPGPQKETGNVRLDSPLLDKRIRKAINTQLRMQRYSQANASSADLLVGYHLSLDRKLKATTVNDHYGYRYHHYGFGGGASHTTIHEYDVGILIIDLVERADNELVWRGTGETPFRNERSPHAADQKVAQVVARILEQFPPSPYANPSRDRTSESGL